MRQRSFIIVALTVGLLLAGAVGVYAYDTAREDTIAEGITVAGVDVGGLDADEARIRLAEEVARPLERPIAVVYERKKFNLSAEDAGVKADIGGMVDAALAKSREPFILARVARDITGGTEDANLSASVGYSRTAVERLVDRVRNGLDRPARDATLDFPSLAQVKEQDGLEVKREELRREIEAALVSREDRRVSAPVRVKKPKYTQAELAERYPTVLVVERGAFRLKYYRRLSLAKTYRIAVGQIGLETPAGLYHIQNKAVDPSWHVPNSAWAGKLAGTVVPPGPSNPIKARWMGIYAGAGIHGTTAISSLGTAASHGCIRMAIPDVIALYPQVPVGTPIYIA
jgi:lipoprotein-anchoring transpeptidase ErfK/SrfK